MIDYLVIGFHGKNPCVSMTGKIRVVNPQLLPVTCVCVRVHTPLVHLYYLCVLVHNAVSSTSPHPPPLFLLSLFMLQRVPTSAM